MGINLLTGTPFQASRIGLMGTDSADADKYRRLSDGKHTRDLTPLAYNKAREMASYQWQRYPLARRFIEILMDFCSGDDLKVNVKIMSKSKDGKKTDTKREDAQTVWDDFWTHPVNDLEGEHEVIFQDLFINGETVLPAFPNEANGSVYLGYIDPSFIEDVVTMPGNQRVVTGLMMKAPEGATPKEHKVIRHDLDPESKTYGKMKGEVFYFRINYMMSQKRGYPEATEYLDWLDAFEQFLFAVLKGFDARNAFFYDVQMDGVDEKKLNSTVIAPPNMGEVKLHNEKVTWQVQTPDLKSVDASEATKLIKNFITGTKGYPDHWFGTGSDTNLATAQVMTAPTVKMLKRKQKTIRRFLKYIGSYVFDQAQEKGTLRIAENEFVDMEVSMFDIEKKDAAVVGAAFVQLSTALSVAQEKNWVTKETSKKIIDGIIGMLGIEIDPSETVEMIEKKNKNEEEEEVINNKPPVPALEEE